MVCHYNTLTVGAPVSIPAGMNNPAAPLLLSHADRDMLNRWALSATAPYRVVTRAKALLLAGDGVGMSRGLLNFGGG